MPYSDPQKQKESQRRYYENNKQKYRESNKGTRARRFEELNKIKDVPCMDCGNSFPPICMDFDHVRGEKVANVSWLLVNGSWQDVLDEVEKCEIVCANCHRIRTQQRGTGWNQSMGRIPSL